MYIKEKDLNIYSVLTGVEIMKKRKEAFTLHFQCVEDHSLSVEIVKNLVRVETNKVFAKHGVVCHNLEEILDKYIT
ncbi:hypothetical protein SAMN04488542_10549 [Fontibacillus panacisegetis]|uniref:Uncharacterized protein n=2 Tax=Fontibacillus panacisegetis TaxID=670482 RepID=A0A1G7HVJ1_9BACL|nr:hypothetical protein SAMN04488542_10549 [Fontibacillus panacisegetis]